MQEAITIFIIALGLAMDSFAVSLGIGTARRNTSPGANFRIPFHLGLIQALMTLLGWLAGTTIAYLISNIDHWLALILLTIVGIRMIRSGFSTETDVQIKDPSRGGTLIMLSVATSIDAVAVGLSLGMLHVNIWISAVVIGLVTMGLSLVGLLTGNKLGERFGKRMEILGGLILIAIGLRILYTHLLILGNP